MHQVTFPLAFLARSGVTVLALLPTPATVFPVLPPPELPQPAATAAHARIAPALASFLFTIFLLQAGTGKDGPPLLGSDESSDQFLTRPLSRQIARAC